MVILSVEFGVHTLRTSDTHFLYKSPIRTLPRELQGQDKHTQDIEFGKRLIEDDGYLEGKNKTKQNMVLF